MASNEPGFLMLTCQVAGESALKREVERVWPAFRFAFSRPGFVTYKLPLNHGLRDDFDPGLVFARSWSFFMGKVHDESLDQRCAAVVKLVEGRAFDRLHVFPRDKFAPGQHRYTPGLTPESQAADAALRAVLSAETIRSAEPPPAGEDDLVLDVVLVSPDEWWCGYHRARNRVSRWPGGLRTIEPARPVISRAYYKLTEGLEWARLPLKQNQTCAEIGCAPGGACQALLEHQVSVIGIDPADVDPSIQKHPRFTHIRKRGHEVRRGEFHAVRWLFADLNVPPSFTLDTIESIVTHPTVHVRGVLLTLKLANWEMADDIPDYLERVRSWGFPAVKARQLQHNRQEVCVAAERPG